ncbi:two-component system, OmpR family, response regulator RpaB [Desulfomicrobium apsheronum]|uniref:Probable transcriptional regulator ycf27 n=1 Tax=Desulfomicrobium apsheronum TaxID=52560 RepID=A0A1I3Q098_9BACT|nr:response regulator transcription factor [Desulfomicrobium apsheronum]MDY0225442.1 response regulator transcription factor [Desulfomicrobium apsheronum]SFJ27604.1 two-component system, OmpR family, response regulator RpaB [Desulfomicrobium apsheronum]
MTQQRILIIDDDADIVKTVSANLELDGFLVSSAPTGNEGLAVLQAYSPDLVLLDLNLPDIDGIKVCQILRRESDAPVIMLSARDTVADKLLGLECGADDYLVKPFNALELSARIRTVLRRVRRSESGNANRQGEIILDYRTHRASIQGREVSLTRTEFSLLELFITHPGEALSRDFIQSQNWGDSKLYSHSRAVDVHVQRLRKKIEVNPQAPRFILTVAGVGYRFEPRPG